MKCPSYVDFFETISQKTRLEIVLLLNKGPLSVTEISNLTNNEQSNISHNLKKLSECKIITSQRKGKNMIYTLNKKTIIPILKLVDKHVKMNCTKCEK